MDRTCVNDHLATLATRLNEFIPTLESAAREVSSLLQQGEIRRGLRGLQEMAEALEQFHAGVDTLASRGRLDDTGLGELKTGLEQVYPSILAALEQEDAVTLADIVEYELVPLLAAHASGVAD